MDYGELHDIYMEGYKELPESMRATLSLYQLQEIWQKMVKPVIEVDRIVPCPNCNDKFILHADDSVDGYIGP